MPLIPVDDTSNSAERLQEIEAEFEKFVAEISADGISPEEAELIERVTSKIEETKRKIELSKKSTPGTDPSTAGGSFEAWEARSKDYQRIIAKIVGLEDEGHAAAETLSGYLHEISDALAEDRYDDALDQLDLLIQTYDLVVGTAADDNEEDQTDAHGIRISDPNAEIPTQRPEQPVGPGGEEPTQPSEQPVGPGGEEPTQPGESPGDGEEPFVEPTEAGQVTLRLGDEDADGWVEYMQKLLREHIRVLHQDVTVPTNGTFDRATDAAVRVFQGVRELLVDGIVGNQTWSALRDQPEIAEIGTDGREPGTHSEEGPEGRWVLEGAENIRYVEGQDILYLAVQSVGTETIEGFTADVFVNGDRQRISLSAGGTIGTDPSTHAVGIPRFAETYGAGPHQIEAYLPQDLGGDRFSTEFRGLVDESGSETEDDEEDRPSGGNDPVVPPRRETPSDDDDIPPGGDEDPQFTWVINATVLDAEGNGISGAGVVADGPSGRTVVTDGRGQAQIVINGAGRYRVRAFHDGQQSQTETFEENVPSSGIVHETELTLAGPIAAETHSAYIRVERTSNGDAVENADVIISPDPQHGMEGTTTNSSGDAHYDELIDGHYAVTAEFDGETGSASFRIDGDDAEVTIRIDDGAEVTTGVNRRCYALNAVPDMQEAVDGTMLPTMQDQIPADVRRGVGEICVQTEVHEGPVYSVVTNVMIETTIVEELGLSWIDLIPRVPLPISVLISMLSSSPTATERYFNETTDDGHRVRVCLIYVAR